MYFNNVLNSYLYANDKNRANKIFNEVKTLFFHLMYPH
jgi:hypothetical protein